MRQLNVLRETIVVIVFWSAFCLCSAVIVILYPGPVDGLRFLV